MAAVIPAVTKLSPKIIRVLGCNPGSMTLQGTNTYIIGTGKRRILIDTGDADVPQYINHLKDVLTHENIDLAHIFISHWHHDHIGGLPDVLELKEATKHCQVWKYPRYGDNSDLPIEPVKDGQIFAVEGATLQVLHTPGHTDDHLVFHLLEDNAIFSGDCILGEGTAVFEDLHEYMRSLQLILDIQPATIYPGHGNVVSEPVEKIEYYIKHRLDREQQIIDVLSNNRKQSFCENDLVKIIYQDLNEKLVKAAEVNVSHHLRKLEKEAKVTKFDKYWQFNENPKAI